MSSKPEISVIIPNYNYGVYLANCFDSILAQTYHNIEVIFRDNNSTDSSMDIAMEYYKKFKEKNNMSYASTHKEMLERIWVMGRSTEYR